jgi:Protein of Unknown function (DUF2784)
VPFQTLANIVLLLHFAVVIFVVLGLPAVLVGNWRGWAWANQLWWRVVHLLAIGVVVLQAWLNRYCGLTMLESSLREKAGQVGYERSFIEYWVHGCFTTKAPCGSLRWSIPSLLRLLPGHGGATHPPYALLRKGTKAGFQIAPHDFVLNASEVR